MRCIWLMPMMIWLGIHAAAADSALWHTKDAQDFIHELQVRDHFPAWQLRKVFNNAAFQPRIIQSMARPYEKKNWDVYQALFLTPERLNSGLLFWRKNNQVLQHVAKQYGVPPEMIVAILGVETLYGKRQGEYRVLDALVTLAFYYPARAAYFKKELREFLLLCREHHAAPDQYKGSYAGAMGKPQFMPSSYRTYALNYAGRGRPDLMHTDQDVIVSVANYFKQHGWRAQHSDAAQKVKIPPDHLRRLVLNSKKPNYTVPELLRVGIKPPLTYAKHAGGVSSQEVGLFEMTTEKGAEYWMAYPNFYVITRYNTSPQYALVVHLLAQSLRAHYAPPMTA